jgi:hypothetical protein
MLESRVSKEYYLSGKSLYPTHWWAPVPKVGVGAPAWEILPQEAGPGEVILYSASLCNEDLNRRKRQGGQSLPDAFEREMKQLRG